MEPHWCKLSPSNTGARVLTLWNRSGVFYFFGGTLQIIGSVLEWIIGNTFPFVVFASYGE